MQQQEFNNNKSEANKSNEFVRQLADEKYKYGFTSDIHTEIIEKGLNEDVIRLISSKKEEPDRKSGV